MESPDNEVRMSNDAQTLAAATGAPVTVPIEVVVDPALMHNTPVSFVNATMLRVNSEEVYVTMLTRLDQAVQVKEGGMISIPARPAAVCVMTLMQARKFAEEVLRQTEPFLEERHKPSPNPS